MTLYGLGASAGVGIGRIVCVREEPLDYTGAVYAGAQAEKQRLQQAAVQFCAQTQAMAARVREQAGESEAAILDGQVEMLNDPVLRAQIDEAIDAGAVAEAAVDSVCTMYAGVFDGLDDELMRQRAADVRDLCARLLGLLLGRASVDLGALPAGTVLAARELTPSMTVGLDSAHVAAIVTETGGPASHAAILARALELPAVLSVPGLMDAVQDGMAAAVDGGEGEVALAPDEAAEAAYRAKRAAWLREKDALKAYRAGPTLDADGRQVKLYANIGRPDEAAAAAAAGAEGVGLLRTEFLFMDRLCAPGEDEQCAAYCRAAQAFGAREVIVRTLDAGGDKPVDYLHMPKEENPFLGHRAIRYCLDEPALFKTQLRALLRAAARHPGIRIMLPMVTCLDEVRAARALLKACAQELDAEGVPHAADVPLGVMIETPSAALIADLLAREADFFSIGTNDLTQYVMAADRGNAQVQRLYTPLQPGVLRCIRGVIEAGRAARIPVGMCGEAAADPRMIPLLLHFGLDEFSVNAASIPATRRAIAQWDGAKAAQAAEAALRCATADEVARALDALCAQRP
ncbi:MAG TPA: phosphoenolpyruvate--protein phosphotransferase [Candidatus Ruthenibacterium merdigallinarum]|nr:phosphoenolpyruvate--protein phosphotransferase [Candidatus Ruthenibacterium merdigallinarum]